MALRIYLVRAPPRAPPTIDDLIDPHTFGKDYRKFGKKLGMTVEQFVQSGGSKFCAGRVLRDVDIIIRFHRHNLRFSVNPHDEDWFERLRARVAESINHLGLAEKVEIESNLARPSGPVGAITSDRIRLEDARYEVGTKPITGGSADRSNLRNYAQFGLRIRVLAVGEGRKAPLSKEPEYQYPKNIVKARGVHTSTADLGAGSARVVASELVNSARSVLHPITVKILSTAKDSMPDGYLETQKAILDQLVNHPQLSEGGTLRKSLMAANCPDIAGAVTDLSRDIAQRVCKVSSSVSENNTATEIAGQAQIACEKVYRDLEKRACCWRLRRALRHPCPRPSTLTPTVCVPVKEVCAPLGEKVVESITTSLISGSFSCPYTSVPTVEASECDGYSSDEAPCKRATQSAGKRRCYRKTRGFYHRHYCADNIKTDDVLLTQNRSVSHRIQVTRGRPFRAVPSVLDGTFYGANNKLHVASSIESHVDLSKADAVPAGITEISVDVNGEFAIPSGLERVACSNPGCAPGVSHANDAPFSIPPGLERVECRNPGCIPGSRHVKDTQDRDATVTKTTVSSDVPPPAGVETPGAQEEAPPSAELNPPAMYAPPAQMVPLPSAALAPDQDAKATHVETPAKAKPGARPVAAHNYPPLPPHGIAVVRCTNNAPQEVTVLFTPVSVHTHGAARVGPYSLSLRADGGMADVSIAAGKYTLAIQDALTGVVLLRRAVSFPQRILHSIMYQANNTIVHTVLKSYLLEKTGLSKIYEKLFGKTHTPGIYIVPSAMVSNAGIEAIHVPCSNAKELLSREVTIGDELLGEELVTVNRFTIPAGKYSAKEIMVDRNLIGTEMLVGGKWAKIEATIPHEDGTIGFIIDAPLEDLLR